MSASGLARIEASAKTKASRARRWPWLPSGGTAAPPRPGRPRHDDEDEGQDRAETHAIAHLRGRLNEREEGTTASVRPSPTGFENKNPGGDKCRPAYDERDEGGSSSPAGPGRGSTPRTRGESASSWLPIYNKPMVVPPAVHPHCWAGHPGRSLLITTPGGRRPRVPPALFGGTARTSVFLALSPTRCSPRARGAGPRPSSSAVPFRFGRDSVALALGDNVFSTGTTCRVALQCGGRPPPAGATVFAYRVRDPSRYGGWVTFRARRPRAARRRRIEEEAGPRPRYSLRG